MSLPNLILSTLADNKGFSGYDIFKNKTNPKGRNVWEASHQQVYREVKRLAENGYIDQLPIDEQLGKPDRIPYMINERGIKALEDNAVCTQKLPTVRCKHTVQLSSLDKLSPEVTEDFWASIERYKLSAANRIEVLTGYSEDINSTEHSSLVTKLRLKKEIKQLEVELEWLEEAEEMLKQH
ncbi:PadR family transcriptional regulator [Vibrio mediterranei]|uniref:PadR family transcriptional regulator n=1 Tax=Vibrio mediterranei TaxID=689 RepID=UPI0040677E1E